MTDEIILFETNGKEISLPVKVDADTVWLNRHQMATLFERDAKTIGKHINNAISEELSSEVVVAYFETTTAHGAMEGKTQTHRTAYYNLDVIISVGYRVKSKMGVEFRRWANKVLGRYIMDGYAANRKRLDSLGKTIELQSKIIAHITEIDTNEMLDVVNSYTAALDMLDDYDHQCIEKPNGSKECSRLELDECYSIIDGMKFGSKSTVFGTEKEPGRLEGILGAVYQSAFGSDLYPTTEEKGANLLYLLVKDHPFNDGCKRIAATLFLSFLHKNGLLKRKDGSQTISNSALVATTLLMAESKPEEKDIMVSLVMNMLKMQ